MSEPQEQATLLSQTIAKCWADEGFKQRLLSDATATLKAEGVEIPQGLKVSAHESTAESLHIIIPPKPTELSDEDLNGIAAGGIIDVVSGAFNLAWQLGTMGSGAGLEEAQAGTGIKLDIKPFPITNPF
jgi:hypothetical protein